MMCGDCSFVNIFPQFLSTYDTQQEVDPTLENEDVGGPEGMDSLFFDLANAILEIDKAMSFAEMLK